MDENNEVNDNFDRTMRLNPDPEIDDNVDRSAEETYVEEYDSVNSALDEINAFMDVLEERNDSLFTKLQQLLEDSRQARLELNEEEGADEDDQQTTSSEPSDTGARKQTDETSPQS